ncbi:MAG: hypothetical protein ABR564_04760 [Candidatus Dormibacteria bacterium]
MALDLLSGRTASLADVKGTPDVLAYDPGLHQLYVATESGPLTVLHMSGMDVRSVSQGFAGNNAHSVSVDPATHRIFLPLADENGHPELRIMAVNGP